MLVDDGEHQAVVDNLFKDVRPAESLAGMKEVYKINRVKWEKAVD